MVYDTHHYNVKRPFKRPANSRNNQNDPPPKKTKIELRRKPRKNKKLKNKLNGKVSTRPHINGTFSYTTIGKPKKYSKWQLDCEELVEFGEDYNQRISTSIGRQNPTDLALGCWITSSLIGTNRPLTLSSTVQTGAIALTNPSSRVYLKSEQNQAWFTNMTNGPVQMQLYDCVLRNNDSTGAPSPGGDWNQGITDSYGDTPTSTVAGSTPFRSQLFVNNWKVVKVHTFSMGPGEVHRHTVTSHINKSFSRDAFTTNGQAENGIAKFTCITLCVTLGPMQNDSTTKTQISWGVSAVDIIQRKTTRICSQAASGKRVYQVASTLVNAFTVAGEMIEEETGGIVADVTA